MYLTVKQQVKHLSKENYKTLRDLCHIAKNLANQAIYNVRQYYFAEGEYLNYQKNYALLKNSDNYKTLNSNMAQQILKEVDGSFKSFFGLLKLAKKGKYSFKDCRLPNYLPKDGYTTLVIGFVRLNGDKLVLPFSQSCYEMTIVKWKYHIPLIFVFFQSRTQDKKLLYRFIGGWPLCYSWIGYLRSMVSPQVSLSIVVNQIFGIRSVYIALS